MFTFIGDHFLALVLASFALFGLTLGGESLRQALSREPSEPR